MIFDVIPSNVLLFLSEIESHGFHLCLVGGSVRDYLLNKNIGNDLDFEVRSIDELSDEQWEIKFSFISELANKSQFKFEILPYLIIRVLIDEYSLEFSSPRIENFIEDKFEHHNFKAKLSSNLNYFESFKRRDFTINAIGAELDFKKKAYKLVDPYKGQDDLKSKRLELISNEFFNDSVRFVRMIRFNLRLNFSISEKIQNNLHLFNLTRLSDFHFKQEAKKTDIGLFLNLFVELVKSNNLNVNEKFNVFKQIDFKFNNNTLKNFDDVVYFSIFHNEQVTEELINFFHLPKNLFSKLIKLKNASLELSNVDKKELLTLLSVDLINLKNTQTFTNLKIVIDNLNHFEQMNLVNKQNIILSLEELKEIKSFSVPDDLILKINPDLRNVYIIQEGLKNVLR